MKHRFLGLVSAAAVAVLLVGCVPKTEVVSPVPQPSVTPPFASDEEALAAAIEAYARYLKVTDEILQGGGKDPSLASTVMTGELLDANLESFNDFIEKGWHTEGFASFDQPRLQQYDQYSTGASVVTIYVCHDISDVTLDDGSGAPVDVPQGRLRTTVLVTLDLLDDQLLLPSNVELWSEEPC
ncbi:MAG: hypothetical protein KF808_05040 [Cryobacterium sp.]|nr:hypothetical protein [Cryobacterium sp.]